MITILSFIFLLFVIIMTFIFDWQPSISNFFNVLPKGWKWIFTLFMCVLGVFCIFIGRNNTMVLMGFSSMLVGFFPRFNDDQKIQHYISAVGIIGAGMWQIGVALGLWYLPIIFIILLYPLTKIKNRIFWIEIVAFLIIDIGLYTK